MWLLLHIILTYIKENNYKITKLYSSLRNPRAGNKLPALFVKKLLCMGDISPVINIFIERPIMFFSEVIKSFRKNINVQLCFL